MSKFVIELQKLCLDSEVACSDILQRAYFLAKKLEIKDLESYFVLEMQGYSDFSEKIPRYRYVNVEYRFETPSYGWRPFVIKRGIGFDNLLCRPIESSIIELEKLSEYGDSHLSFPIPGEVQKLLNKQAKTPVLVHICGFFEKAALAKIFQEVRKVILDWTLELEKKGILGEEYMFTEKEKESAKEISNVNITINGNISDSNVIGALQNSTVNKESTLDFDKVALITKQISDNIQNIGLKEEEKIAIINEITEIRFALENKDSLKILTLLKHIKSICCGVTDSIIASGIIQQISNLLP